MASLLIVDDLSSIHEMLEAVIQPTGHEPVFAQDGEKALALYKSQGFDVVLADISMQPMDGITLLKQLKDYDPLCVVIMMTGYASTDTAIKALKYGAFDYIKKPFKVDELLQTLDRAVEYRKVLAGSQGAAAVPPPVASTSETSGELEELLPGTSQKAVRLRRQVAKLIGSQTPVLLQGETGTGKKMLAEILHRGRGGEEASLIAVDCSLGDDETFREMLFGEDNQGGAWIQEAAGGTLFLENIDRLSADMQETLVNVLKNNISRFRLICSSAIDLEERVDEGEFSDELFYRIATLPVNLPPLRENFADLESILKTRIARVEGSKFDARQIEFTPEALEAMTRYGWPGNLTELNQVVSSVVSTAEERVIGLEQLPLRIRPLADWPTLDEYLAPRERHYVRTVLAACGNDEEKALSVLGCEPSRLETLVNS
jgi:two-component system, NtrC family, response regulator HydG